MSKQCPHCGTYLESFASVCPGCGAEKVVNETSLSSKLKGFIFGMTLAIVPLMIFGLNIWTGFWGLAALGGAFSSFSDDVSWHR